LLGAQTVSTLPPPYPVRLEIDYPEKLSRLTTFFRYIVGLMRWRTRVGGYTSLLVTDRYPPLSMS
jgi:hypothetical protein